MSVKQITTGQDSFLDIVANLVGILIILVVVVGTQAGTAAVRDAQPKSELVDTTTKLTDELNQQRELLTKLEIDNQRLEDQIAQENQIAAGLTDQRHAMLVELEWAKREIQRQREQRQQKIESEQAEVRARIAAKEKFDAKEKALKQKLSQIVQATNAISASAPKSKTIDHFPNPIAKTVFSNEVHFRLSDGKLAYVPMDELIMRMKAEWKVKAEKLRTADRTLETVGPVAGFRMQYELETYVSQQQTEVGVVDRTGVRLKQFHIFPTAAHAGETIDQAIADNSAFREIIQRSGAGRTTVSVWVYPDSFSQHNQLKRWLHEHGFQMASWPLDHGKKISGGPNGFRTSAQ